MPNALAHVVLYSWPLVVVVLFRTLPLQKALPWSIVAGYLLLPERAGLNLPMVPALDKALIPSVAAAVMCLVATRAAARTHRPAAGAGAAPPAKGPARWIFAGLLVLALAAPFVTVFQNAEPVFARSHVLPPLRPHDAFSLVVGVLVLLTPYLLAQRFLATAQAHRTLLAVLATAMLGYSLPILFEVRMSPQLNNWIYGFFPHDFLQHIRGGGFRPVVFLNHGLWLGIVISMSVLAACALWRQALRDRVAATPWLYAVGWLALTLVLSRNFGATALALLVAPVILFASIRVQLLLAGIIAGCVLLFPMLRGAGWIPTDTIVSVAAAVSEERAESLAFRMDQDDRLLAHANRKPLGGWGGWGRNMAVEYDGPVIIDGYWVLVIGQTGWLGYIARFGFLTAPLLLLALRRRQAVTPATAGLALVLAVGLIDLIPNATISPVTWLVAGALAGHCLRVGAKAPAAQPLPAGPAPARWQPAYPGGPLRPAAGPAGAAAPAAAAAPPHRRRPRG